jgi:hypothetical protein
MQLCSRRAYRFEGAGADPLPLSVPDADNYWSEAWKLASSHPIRLMPASSLCGSRSRRLTLLLVLLAPTVSLAQDVTEVTLKSVFIFNFIRFTEWPADTLAAGATISACVVGDPAVADALARTVRGRRLDGRTIAVSILQPEAALPTCHLLYVSGLEGKRTLEIVAALRTAPILTISDLGDFAKKGGMVQLFPEAGRMRFSVNIRATRRARLQLSSRLLRLADLIEEQGSLSPLAIPITDPVIEASPL